LKGVIVCEKFDHELKKQGFTLNFFPFQLHVTPVEMSSRTIYIAERIHNMMPRVMENLMPHMIKEVVPLVTQPMIDYLRGETAA
jgi:hypothetical protein